MIEIIETNKKTNKKKDDDETFFPNLFLKKIESIFKKKLKKIQNLYISV